MNKNIERIKNGIITENPTFVQILGMCPTLAVTTSAMNGLGMGLSTTVILIMSNLMISALRNVIPNRVRIPAYIVIVATFVTIIDFLLQAWLPGLSESLGGYIKLIVVNCIILGRAESYASKNPVVPSVFDGVGMGLGFTVGLTAIGLVRELLGAGSVFGFVIPGVQPIGIFVLSPGAFLVLAFLIAILNYRKLKKKSVEATSDTVCRVEDCLHCGNTSCGGKFFDFDGETDAVGRIGQKQEEPKAVEKQKQEEPKAKKESEKQEEPEVKEEPKAKEEPEVKEEPKAKEEPEVKEEPKAKEEPEVKEEPKAKEEPEVKEEPKAKEKPEAKEEPKAKEKPEAKEESKKQEEPDEIKEKEESKKKEQKKKKKKSKKSKESKQEVQTNE